MNCACGCGTAIPGLDPKGRLRRFAHGHNGRLQTLTECRVVTCHRSQASRGLCGRHLMRVKKHGTVHPATARLNPERYFWSLVRRPLEVDGCWEWEGPLYPHGYGYFGRSNASPLGDRLAHRISYSLRNGVLIDGMHIDHLCRNTKCVNPEHLEQVTGAENTRRGLHGVLRTHCRSGHELAEENTYVKPSDNSRKCRTCLRIEAARRRAAVRSEFLAGAVGQT